MEFTRFLPGKKFRKHLLYAILAIFVFFILVFQFLKIYTHHGKSLPVPDFRGLNMEEAEKIAKNNHVVVKLVDSVFQTDMERGAIVEQHPKPGFKVKKKRTVFLTRNALNPDSTTVPNLIDLSLRQAQTIIRSNKLKIGRLTYVPNIAVNRVLKQRYKGQDIIPGKRVVKGSTLDLVVGLGLSDKKTLVPHLIGLQLTDAEQQIIHASLNLGALTYDETVITKEDSLNAIIWKQNPLSVNEAPINLGSSVFLWVTTDSTKLPVPDSTEWQIDTMSYDFSEN